MPPPPVPHPWRRACNIKIRISLDSRVLCLALVVHIFPSILSLTKGGMIMLLIDDVIINIIVTC